MSAALCPLPLVRPVLCLGGANVDRKLRVAGELLLGSSNPVSALERMGGVARNVAENLARLGLPVHLLAAVGQDGAGAALLAHAAQCGIATEACAQVPGALTGSYTAVLQADGGLCVALAHMDVCEHLTPAWLAGTHALRQQASVIVADLNLPRDSLAALVAERAAAADSAEAPSLVLVAVSEAKMARLPADLHGVRLLVLNQGELAAWAKAVLGTADLDSRDAQCCALNALRAAGVRDVVLTLGAQGVLCSEGDGAWRHLPATPLPADAVVDVTGAGDALSAGLCCALACGEVARHGLAWACERALGLAALTLQTDATVVPSLSPADWTRLCGVATPAADPILNLDAFTAE